MFIDTKPTLSERAVVELIGGDRVVKMLLLRRNGMSLVQIGDLFDLPVAIVETRLNNAEEKLQGLRKRTPQGVGGGA